MYSHEFRFIDMLLKGGIWGLNKGVWKYLRSYYSEICICYLRCMRDEIYINKNVRISIEIITL